MISQLISGVDLRLQPKGQGTPKIQIFDTYPILTQKKC